MIGRGAFGGLALAAALALSVAGANAFDDAKYPDWSGSWLTIDGPARGSFDPSKPKGAQQAPLKPEFQKDYSRFPRLMNFTLRRMGNVLVCRSQDSRTRFEVIG